MKFVHVTNIHSGKIKGANISSHIGTNVTLSFRFLCSRSSGSPRTHHRSSNNSTYNPLSSRLRTSYMCRCSSCLRTVKTTTARLFRDLEWPCARSSNCMTFWPYYSWTAFWLPMKKSIALVKNNWRNFSRKGQSAFHARTSRNCIVAWHVRASIGNNSTSSVSRKFHFEKITSKSYKPTNLIQYWTK